MASSRQAARLRRAGASTPDRDGFTLFELMVAAVLLLVVVFTMGDVYTRSRTLNNLDEEWRQASAVAQGRLDRIRSESSYDELGALSDTTLTVAGRDFAVTHVVRADFPDTNTTTVTVVVSWEALTAGGPLERDLSYETILSRSKP